MIRFTSRIFVLLKHGLSAAALLVAPVLLAACSSSDRPSEQVLHYSNLDDPRRLDPAFVKDLYEGIVSGFLYDGLTGFGTGTEIEPRLAHTWEVSRDGRTYTFRLRPARFSDGRPVRAQDVRYSFERILHPATGSDRKWVLNRIAGAREFTSGTANSLRGLVTPDERTVQITLDSPSPLFLTMLAMPTASIIPEGSAGAAGQKPDPAFDAKPVGTGPWVLSRRERDRLLEFTPNKHHWGNLPKLDRLIYHVQVDDTVRRKQFEIGALDIYQVGFQAWDSWRRNPPAGVELKPVQELRTDFVGINTSRPPLNDVRVRRALLLGTDREKIFRRLQKERGVLAAGPVPPEIAGHRSELTPLPYDPGRAGELLSEAGVTTSGPDRLQLGIWYREEALNSEIVHSIKADLEELGIEVTPVPRDQAALRSGIWSGAYDLFLGSWTLDYPDPENALAPTFHSRNIPRQGNQTFFSDPETDRLIEAAEKEVHPQKRIQAWQLVEDRVREQSPWIPLFHRQAWYAVQPEVQGWTPALMYNAERFKEVIKTYR